MVWNPLEAENQDGSSSSRFSYCHGLTPQSTLGRCMIDGELYQESGLSQNVLIHMLQGRRQAFILFSAITSVSHPGKQWWIVSSTQVTETQILSSVCDDNTCICGTRCTVNEVLLTIRRCNQCPSSTIRLYCYSGSLFHMIIKVGGVLWLHLIFDMFDYVASY